MDDKDQDQAATDTPIGTAGSTLGGAAAGAVAGTALGVPGRRDRDWCALRCCNWSSKEANYTEGEGGHCTAKKKNSTTRAINQDESEADHAPAKLPRRPLPKSRAKAAPSNLHCNAGGQLRAATVATHLTVG